MIFSLALIAAIGFFISSKAASTGLARSIRTQHLSMLISAGILLGIAFTELIPEAFHMASGFKVTLALVAGFVALYLVETLTGGHTHHHEPHTHSHTPHSHAPHSHTHDHGHHTTPAPNEPGCVPFHAIIPFLIGLGAHNLTDGIVIAASAQASNTTASAVAFGILIHQIPVGLSFAAVLVASGWVGRRLLLSTLWIALLIPTGALLILMLPSPSTEQLGWLLAATAGALIYIATGHLLPEAHSEERRPSYAAAFAISLLATSAFISIVHENAAPHSHDHIGVAHAEEHHDEAHSEHDH